MQQQVTYGVFRLGQIWAVVADDGTRLGFPPRERALDTAMAMAAVDASCGRDAEIAAQDELGMLTTIRAAHD